MQCSLRSYTGTPGLKQPGPALAEEVAGGVGRPYRQAQAIQAAQASSGQGQAGWWCDAGNLYKGIYTFIGGYGCNSSVYSVG